MLEANIYFSIRFDKKRCNQICATDMVDGAGQVDFEIRKQTDRKKVHERISFRAVIPALPFHFGYHRNSSLPAGIPYLQPMRFKVV